jgi:hypothetical protein
VCVRRWRRVFLVEREQRCGYGVGHVVDLDGAQSGARHAFGAILQFVVGADKLVEDGGLLSIARHGQS